MKNLIIKTVFLLVASFAFSCDQNDNADPEFLSPGATLTGSWLMTEYGYSPGGGYFTEPIAPVPAQTIAFNANGEMWSNAEGLTQYKYYRVMEDPYFPGSGYNIVVLFTTNPEGQPLDPKNLSPSYSIVFTDTLLKLSYRWCIEGCHLGMKRISHAYAAPENP
jgi:hypothetical protein